MAYYNPSYPVIRPLIGIIPSCSSGIWCLMLISWIPWIFFKPATKCEAATKTFFGGAKLRTAKGVTIETWKHVQPETKENKRYKSNMFHPPSINHHPFTNRSNLDKTCFKKQWTLSNVLFVSFNSGPFSLVTSPKTNMDTKNGHIYIKGATFSKPSFWVSMLVFVG